MVPKSIPAPVDFNKWPLPYWSEILQNEGYLLIVGEYLQVLRMTIIREWQEKIELLQNLCEVMGFRSRI